MKLYKLILPLMFLSINSFSQTKNFIDQPYIETQAEVDALVVPDRIYLTITINESDSRNKVSTEEQEKQMIKVLKAIGIDTNKDLSLLELNSHFKKFFLSDKKVLKTKMYSLLVRDGFTAGKALVSLEKANISNVQIRKVEYSKLASLMLELKTKAILKAKRTAESLATPLNQKVGKALLITDVQDTDTRGWAAATNVQIRGSSSIYGNRATEPFALDFKELKFTAKVSVKFALQ
jgi:uncharacterized protein YggE